MNEYCNKPKTLSNYFIKNLRNLEFSNHFFEFSTWVEQWIMESKISNAKNAAFHDGMNIAQKSNVNLKIKLNYTKL